jgi:hypothetical protein
MKIICAFVKIFTLYNNAYTYFTDLFFAIRQTTLAARQQILDKQQFSYNSEERCFLCGPRQDVITRRVRSESSVVGYSPDSNDVSTEAEQTPLSEAATRK